MTKCGCRRLPTSMIMTKCGCRRLPTSMFMTKCSCRKSPTTCRKPNAIAGGYKHSCFTLPEMYGSLQQSAGNLRRCTEVPRSLQETNGDVRKSPTTCGNQRRSTGVSRSLWETQCSFQGLFGNRNGELVFLLLDVYGFSFSETQRIKPFSLKPDFRDGDHLAVAFLVSCVNFNFSGIHHGAVFRFFTGCKGGSPDHF